MGGPGFQPQQGGSGEQGSRSAVGSRNRFVSLLVETLIDGNRTMSNLVIEVTSCCMLQLCSEPP